MLAQQGSIIWLSYYNRFLRAAPEFLRHVTPGEELPWSEVEKLFRQQLEILDGPQEISFEQIGPEQGIDAAPEGPEPVPMDDDSSMYTGEEDEAEEEGHGEPADLPGLDEEH